MSRESRLRRTPSCAARPIAYVAPARSMTTTNRAATATGYGQPLQKSTGASLGRHRRLRFSSQDGKSGFPRPIEQTFPVSGWLACLDGGLGASPLVQEPRFYAAFQTVCIGCGRHAQREHPTQRGIPTYAPTTLAFSATCAKNWRFERRSRAADDRRNDEQSAMLSAKARPTTSALCEERRRRQLPARRARSAQLNGGC